MFLTGTSTSSGIGGLSGRYVDIISQHNFPNNDNPGLSLCEVKVYGRDAVAGYVRISSENSNGTCCLDACSRWLFLFCATFSTNQRSTLGRVLIDESLFFTLMCSFFWIQLNTIECD